MVLDTTGTSGTNTSLSVEDHNRTTFLEGTSSKRDELLARFELATLSSILVLTLGGNLLVLYALQRQRQRQKLSRVYQLMGHLSFADLLVGLLNILPQLAWDITFRFQGGLVVCKLVKFGQVFSLYLSSLLLVAMSLDRYFVIEVQQLKINPQKFIKYIVSFCYIMSALLASPQMYVFTINEIQPGVEDCWANWDYDWGPRAYTLYFLASAFGVPILIISYCYGHICRCIFIYSRDKDVHTGGGVDLTQAKIDTLKMTLTVVIFFVACWTPFCFALLYKEFMSPTDVPPFMLPVLTICLLLASLNSCTNPWIYLAFSTGLLNEFKGILNNIRDAIGLQKDTYEDTSDMELDPVAPYRLRPAYARPIVAEKSPQTKKTTVKGTTTQNNGNTPMVYQYDGPIL